MSNNDLLTVSQVAERLNAPKRTVRYWIERGLMPAIPLLPGRKRPTYRVRESDVQAIERSKAVS